MRARSRVHARAFISICIFHIRFLSLSLSLCSCMCAFVLVNIFPLLFSFRVLFLIFERRHTRTHPKSLLLLLLPLIIVYIQFPWSPIQLDIKHARGCYVNRSLGQPKFACNGWHLPSTVARTIWVPCACGCARYWPRMCELNWLVASWPRWYQHEGEAQVIQLHYTWTLFVFLLPHSSLSLGSWCCLWHFNFQFSHNGV